MFGISRSTRARLVSAIPSRMINTIIMGPLFFPFPISS
jgi:hypothetical protein